MCLMCMYCLPQPPALACEQSNLAPADTAPLTSWVLPLPPCNVQGDAARRYRHCADGLCPPGHPGCFPGPACCTDLQLSMPCHPHPSEHCVAHTCCPPLPLCNVQGDAARWYRHCADRLCAPGHPGCCAADGRRRPTLPRARQQGPLLWLWWFLRLRGLA